MGVRSPLIAPPLEQLPPWPDDPPKVLCTIVAGYWLRAADELSRSFGVGEFWANTRMAAPPRSGPFVVHVLRTKTDRTTLSLPPSCMIAPPPLSAQGPLLVEPDELPSANVMFWMVTAGLAGAYRQLPDTLPREVSQVLMKRMRLVPPPDIVIKPPPSITSFAVLFRTLRVSVMVIVSGFGPQLKVMTPPAVTAVANAAAVQLAGVPVPMTEFGALMSSSPMPAGTVAVPFGLPGLNAGGGVGGGGVGAGTGNLIALLFDAVASVTATAPLLSVPDSGSTATKGPAARRVKASVIPITAMMDTENNATRLRLGNSAEM